MSVAGEVVVAIKAVDEASSVMGQIRATLNVFSGVVSELGGGFTSISNVISGFAGAGVMGAASAAIGEFVKGLQWCVGQASEAEQAIKNLAIAVQQSGTNWSEVAQKTTEYLSKLQETTKFSDEKLAGALQRLLTLGVDYKTAMESLAAVTDLAAARQIDLETAATAVGRALTGNTTALQRLGVHLDEVKGKTAEIVPNFTAIEEAVSKAGISAQTLNEYFANVAPKAQTVGEVIAGIKKAFEEGKMSIDQIEESLGDLGISFEGLATKGSSAEKILAVLNERFGGTAAQQAETYAGTQERLKNAVSDLGEKIGGALLPVLDGLAKAQLSIVQGASGFIDAIGRMWSEFTKLPEVQKLAEGLNTAWQQLQQGFATVAEEVGTALMPVFQELWNVLKELWAAIQPVFEAFGEIWKALTGVSEQGKNAYTIFNLLADILKVTVVPALQGLVEVIKLVTPVIKLLAEGFKSTVEIVAPVIRELIELIGGFVNTIKEILGGFWKWLVGGSFVQELMDAVFAAFKAGFDNLVKGITEWLGGIVNTLQAWGKTITDIFSNMWNGVANFVGDIWKKINDAVSSGASQTQNTIQNLSNSVAGESIWPDMWDLMLQQTREGMRGILTETQRGLGGIESAFGGTALSLSPAAGRLIPEGGAGAPASPSLSNVTVNVHMGDLTVGDHVELSRFLYDLQRQIVDAVRRA
jgi:phage-related protein